LWLETRQEVTTHMLDDHVTVSRPRDLSVVIRGCRLPVTRSWVAYLQIITQINDYTGFAHRLYNGRHSSHPKVYTVVSCCYMCLKYIFVLLYNSNLKWRTGARSFGSKIKISQNDRRGIISGSKETWNSESNYYCTLVSFPRLLLRHIRHKRRHKNSSPTEFQRFPGTTT